MRILNKTHANKHNKKVILTRLNNSPLLQGRKWFYDCFARNHVLPGNLIDWGKHISHLNGSGFNAIYNKIGNLLINWNFKRFVNFDPKAHLFGFVLYYTVIPIQRKRIFPTQQIFTIKKSFSMKLFLICQIHSWEVLELEIDKRQYFWGFKLNYQKDNQHHEGDF